MKLKDNSKYIFYIILFIVFILIRINYILLSTDVNDISFQGLSIIRAGFPFGIIKETVLKSDFLPIYYLIISLFKNEILIKILNSIIAFLSVFMLIKIGTKLLNKQLGIFLGLFLSINHFFLYYTNLFAPYCLTFLIQTLIINSLIDFLKKPDSKNTNKLNIFNCALIFCDSLGFLYVLCELLVLYFLFENKKIFKKQVIKLSYRGFIAFLIVFVILIIQYAIRSSLLIPNTINGIGLNLNGLFLMVSEYITPFLSFCAPEIQTKSTIGMIYSFFLNPDIKNINSLKILITLFYSSILPLFFIFFVAVKAFFKNYKLRILSLVSLTNIGIILLLVLYGKIDLHPIYSIQFFITNLILLGYGIFLIKDKVILLLIVISLCLIQFINPEINTFNVLIDKKSAVLNPVNLFIKDYKVDSNDLIIMPYMGKFGALYYKKLNFFDFDYSYLQEKKKNGIIKNISNKKTKTINKNNILYLMKDYLEESRINEYLTQYFVEKCLDNNDLDGRIMLIVDKINSKPISKSSIYKYANLQEYSPSLRKIDFKYLEMGQNQSKLLFEALKSKTLYNFVDLLCGNFAIIDIVEYKKIDNEYYKINSSKNINQALNSFESDYVFVIFKQR